MKLEVNQDSLTGRGNINILCISGIEADELKEMIEYCFLASEANHIENSCEMSIRLGRIIKITGRFA